MKQIGIDCVTTSGGAGSPNIRPPLVEPGYMAPFAESVRVATGIRTMAVGMIVTPRQAETVVAEGRADMVAIGRGFLDDPRWAIHAAVALGENPPYQWQYEKARPQAWPGYRLSHAL